MKRFIVTCAALGAGLVWTSFALAAQPQLGAPTAPAAGDELSRGTIAAYFEEQKQAEAAVSEDAEDTAAPADNCACATEPSCSTEPACGEEAACGEEVGCGDAAEGPTGIFCEDWCTLCIDD